MSQGSIVRCVLFGMSLSALCWGCESDEGDAVPPPAWQPEAVDDDWEVSDPAAQGLDPRLFAALDAVLDSGGYGPVDGLIVARHGSLVYERYGSGFDRETSHDLRSVTKSITSLVVGAAIDRGSLEVDARVASFFPDYETVLTDKSDVTVDHLLTMRSGLDCDDWDPASPGQEDKMYLSDDWVGFILELDVLEPPGATARYCTGGVVLLGEVVRAATATAYDEFAQTALFDPLRISSPAWEFTPSGRVDSGGHLRITPRDMAKVGQLVLDGGRWDGVSVVSERWIADATAPAAMLGTASMGRLWWSGTFSLPTADVDVVFARGNGGQFIVVLPSLDMVAVSTASHYNHPRAAEPLDMIARFIIPAAFESVAPEAREN